MHIGFFFNFDWNDRAFAAMLFELSSWRPASCPFQVLHILPEALLLPFIRFSLDLVLAHSGLVVIAGTGKAGCLLPPFTLLLLLIRPAFISARIRLVLATPAKRRSFQCVKAASQDWTLSQIKNGNTKQSINAMTAKVFKKSMISPLLQKLYWVKFWFLNRSVWKIAALFFFFGTSFLVPCL